MSDPLQAAVGSQPCKNCGQKVTASTFHPPDERVSRCGGCMTLNQVEIYE